MPRDRLDKCVVAFLRSGDLKPSRAEVQRWIVGERVLLDGQPASASAHVRVGATITARPMPPPLSEATPDARIRLVVVYEDSHLLVVDKPAGLVVHPARGHAGGTLVNGLLARGGFDLAPADERDPQGQMRPGIVHRLDKGTSGLLVVAKNARTREGLKALFQAHDIDREYVAIVVGVAEERTIATMHGRHPKDRLRFTSRGRIAHPKQAVTHVRVLEELKGATVVACTLETGRTHQIRVHLAEQLKTPVLGDPIYGSVPADPALARASENLGHQALHARLLGFVHPMTGEALRFESALPEDMARALELLRAR
jgi:23S rRNA pseudouridine1911/1915/1917 synthase